MSKESLMNFCTLIRECLIQKMSYRATTIWIYGFVKSTPFLIRFIISTQICILFNSNKVSLVLFSLRQYKVFLKKCKRIETFEGRKVWAREENYILTIFDVTIIQRDVCQKKSHVTWRAFRTLEWNTCIYVTCKNVCVYIDECRFPSGIEIRIVDASLKPLRRKNLTWSAWRMENMWLFVEALILVIGRCCMRTKICFAR